MTLAELITYLDRHMDAHFIDGDITGTLEKVRAGTHGYPIEAEIIAAVMQGAQVEKPDDLLERAVAVKALSPVRLKYMQDDAPVEGFRRVEKTIVTLDAAFNDEALRLREK